MTDFAYPCRGGRVALVRRLAFLVGAALLWAVPARSSAYIEIPYTLGRVVNESTNILLMRVESVDKEKNTIIYRKVRDIKGTHNGDEIRHNIGRGGFHPREWQTVMAWAEVGRLAVFMYQGGACETCIDGYWYQTYAGGEWYNFSHAEPFLARTFYGRPERLASYIASMLAGQEVVVPCMVDGDKMALQLRTARVQRMRASLKIMDYNAARDFVGWGVEEFRPIRDMPGFTHLTSLAKVSPIAGGLAMADFDGDGRTDFAMFGGARFVLLQNAGGSLNETPLPVEGGARAADWADCNANGRADLLVAAPDGLRLFLNEAKGFRDATTGLPSAAYQHITAAAWVDYNGDGRPDILLADGFRGLRLYRNKTGEQPKPENVKDRFGPWLYAGPFDNTAGEGFAKAYPPEAEPFDAGKTWPGKDGRAVKWQTGQKFVDGQVNSLALFGEPLNQQAVVYLYREIHSSQRVDLPVSLGSDDTLSVWLNRRQLLALNENRPCAPDQNQVTLRLRPGKNELLIKICNNHGDFAFYFQTKGSLAQAPPSDLFEDVSDAVGLGERGLCSSSKVSRLLVGDVNNDGRDDVLVVFPSMPPVLLLNSGKGFAATADNGISSGAGDSTPLLADLDGDGKLDLLVPHATGGLFRGDGKGRFTNMTARAGQLGSALVNATSAALLENRGGPPDIILGCVNGPNRWLKNGGNGTFADITEAVGLGRRIFNTRGVGVADLNGDGVLDVVFVNEGQESTALLRALPVTDDR